MAVRRNMKTPRFTLEEHPETPRNYPMAFVFDNGLVDFGGIGTADDAHEQFLSDLLERGEYAERMGLPARVVSAAEIDELRAAVKTLARHLAKLLVDDAVQAGPEGWPVKTFKECEIQASEDGDGFIVSFSLAPNADNLEKA